MYLKLFKPIGLNLQRVHSFSSSTGSSHFDQIVKMLYSRNLNEIKSTLDSVNLASETYGDLLHIAVSATQNDHNKLEILEYMLNKEVWINKSFAKAYGIHHTPLMVAAKLECDEALELLLKHNADPNIASDLGVDIFHRNVVPLHLTAIQGNLKTTQLLIEHHATVDSKNAVGETPLLHACRKGHVDIMNILLDHHADPHIQSNYELAPLDFINENDQLRESYRSRDNLAPTL